MINDVKCCDPDAPIETCIVCGSSIHTCERETSVNDNYFCPVNSHNNGWELSGGIWVCSEECDHQYFADLAKPQSFDNLEVKWFSPFGFLFYKRPKIDTDWYPSDDLYQYGFSLDLTTELYYYTYDWGKGFNFRILGWGFEIVKMGK